MAQIPASDTELFIAFDRLKKAVRASTAHTEANFAKACKHLLCCYAAECGLKLAYLQMVLKKPASTDDIVAGVFGTDGHDLKRGVDVLHKIIKPSATSALASLKNKQLQTCKIPSNLAVPKRLTNYTIAHAHQCWRYGIKMDTGSEAGLVSWYKRVIEWIETCIKTGEIRK